MDLQFQHAGTESRTRLPQDEQTLYFIETVLAKRRYKMFSLLTYRQEHLMPLGNTVTLAQDVRCSRLHTPAGSDVCTLSLRLRVIELC